MKVYNGINGNAKEATNFADPTAAGSLSTKAYVDARLAGLSWKAGVVAASTANVTLASAVENGDSIDGVTLATGNRVLLKNQTAPEENGVWVVAASGAPTRATDVDSTSELENATVAVKAGTVNHDTAWTQVDTVTTVNTTAQTWNAFGGGATYSADGNGIELSSTTFSLELDGSTLTKGSSGLRIGSGAAGAGLVDSSGVLAVGAGTGITVNTDDVAINTSVVVRKFAANCVVTTNPQTFAHSLGTADLTVCIYESGVQVYPDVSVDSTNVTVDWGGAPTSAQYRVVAHG